MNKKYTGLEKDAPIVKNARGGEHGDIKFAFDLIDPVAMMKMANVMYDGSKLHKKDGWRLLSVDEHLNHLLMHVYAYLAGDKQDEHLAHALCRAMFAVAVHERPEYTGDNHEKSI